MGCSALITPLMNERVSNFTVVFALVISFGLIWLGISGVDIPQLANAFFGLVLLVGVGGVVLCFIASLLRP